MATRKTVSSAGKGSDATVRQTIVETLEAPRLRGISTEDFVKFKQQREVYKRRVEEKGQEGFNVSLTTYRSSIDEPILALMLRARWIEAESVDVITEEQLENCIDRRAHIPPSKYDLAQVEKGIAHVKLSNAQKNLEMKVWELDLHYATVLKNLGYSEFIEKQPELAIKHIFKQIVHKQLRSRMALTFKLRKKELKEDYGKFMRELAAEAQVIDRQEAASAYDHGASLTDSETENKPSTQDKPGNNRSGKKRQRKWGHSDNGDSKKEGDGKTTDGSKHKKAKPKCLNPDCDGSQYIRDCSMTTAEQARKLLKEFRENSAKGKTKQEKGHLGSLGDSYRNSSLFRGTFCEGAIEVMVKGDQGSDANLMPPSVLKQILQSDPTTVITPLKQPVFYGTIVKEGPKVRCCRKVKYSIMLYIRHGTTLALRGMEWMISDEETDFVIIGEPVFCALGLNNRELLEAACDRHGGTVDVESILEECAVGNEGQSRSAGTVQTLINAARLQMGSTFHCDGGDEEEMEESDVYVNLGNDPPERLEAALAERVEEARKEGLSAKGAETLTHLLNKYKSVFEYGWANLHQPRSCQ